MDTMGDASLYEVLANLKESEPSSLGGGGQKSRPRDKPHPIREDITNDPNAIAKVGYNIEPKNMSCIAIDAKKFVKWYHINKVFLEQRWKFYHKQEVALIHYRKNPHFEYRLLEVTHVLFLDNKSL